MLRVRWIESNATATMTALPMGTAIPAGGAGARAGAQAAAQVGAQEVSTSVLLLLLSVPRQLLDLALLPQALKRALKLVLGLEHRQVVNKVMLKQAHGQILERLLKVVLRLVLRLEHRQVVNKVMLKQAGRPVGRLELIVDRPALILLHRWLYGHFLGSY